MSFDLFLQRHEKGESSSEPIDRVKSHFSHIAAGSDPGFWQVLYDEQNSCDVYASPLDNDPSQLSSLTLSRPCQDIRLWNSIFSLLKSGPWALFYPHEAPSLTIADAHHLMHLPEGLVEAAGPATVVASGLEIRRRVSS